VRGLICILLSFLSLNISATENSVDSYTIQRLIISNPKGEVLLEKNNYGWMTPALRHNSKASIKDGLSHLAEEFGLTISSPKIAGIFVSVSGYKTISHFRQHYRANYLDGELKVPENRLDAQWFSIEKAISMMSLPDTKAPFSIGDMTQKILINPEVIWGGTFLINKQNGKFTYEMIEDFYPLN
jgi:hypothetical protein